MNKKSNSIVPKETRRNFIKEKILGGLFFAAGIPLLSFGNIFKSENATSLMFPIAPANKKMNWDEIREQFVIQKGKHYFNSASYGPSPRVVIDHVCETLRYLESEVHTGHELTASIHDKVSTFLNTSPDEIAITRNATEGMNIIARSLPLKAGDEILLSSHEHIGGSAPWIALQKDIGVVIKLIDLDLTGKDNFQIIKDHITERTKVVSFSHITCTTGMCLPAKKIVAYCRKKGIYSCVDGAQALGMISIDLEDINPDFYTCSGHKWLFGPKGTGILFINKRVIEKCSPVFVGAYSDSKFDLVSLTLEYKITAQREEYGTRNIPIMAGLGSAIDFISTIGIENIEARGKELAKYFRTGLSQHPKIEILTPEDSNFSASMITIRIKNKDNSVIRNQISRENDIHVRLIHENDINGLRISFAIFNSIQEVDSLIHVLKTKASE
ncbi:MAG: hypothetical protein COA58_06695 [Bacteroidetes bacterium]|nr:MAG: hypothetical protein COA58_06695 [Bacteroidota bacterium]